MVDVRRTIEINLTHNDPYNRLKQFCQQAKLTYKFSLLQYKNGTLAFCQILDSFRGVLVSKSRFVYETDHHEVLKCIAASVLDSLDLGVHDDVEESRHQMKSQCVDSNVQSVVENIKNMTGTDAVIGYPQGIDDALMKFAQMHQTSQMQAQSVQDIIDPEEEFQREMNNLKTNQSHPAPTSTNTDFSSLISGLLKNPEIQQLTGNILKNAVNSDVFKNVAKPKDQNTSTDPMMGGLFTMFQTILKPPQSTVSASVNACNNACINTCINTCNDQTTSHVSDLETQVETNRCILQVASSISEMDEMNDSQSDISSLIGNVVNHISQSEQVQQILEQSNL